MQVDRRVNNVAAVHLVLGEKGKRGVQGTGTFSELNEGNLWEVAQHDRRMEVKLEW